MKVVVRFLQKPEKVETLFTKFNQFLFLFIIQNSPLKTKNRFSLVNNRLKWIKNELRCLHLP